MDIEMGVLGSSSMKPELCTALRSAGVHPAARISVGPKARLSTGIMCHTGDVALMICDGDAAIVKVLAFLVCEDTQCVLCERWDIQRRIPGSAFCFFQVNMQRFVCSRNV